MLPYQEISRQQLCHRVPHSRQGQYYTVEFAVPADCDRLEISYGYETYNPDAGRGPETSNVVDLGLEDQNGRFLGWSGGARQQIWVGPDSATPGYLKCALTPGVWRILLGAYRIPAAGLEVHYDLRFLRLPERFWMAGDLHMHSTASDGQHSRETLIQKAQALGLDYIAISDHNNYSENLQLPKPSDLTLIPAVEWTHYRGHMNLFGVPEPFASFVANSDAERLALLQEARRRGALISVNHPRDRYCPYLWDDRQTFDLVEVWNGPMRPSNLAAIEWWRGLLAEGRQVPLAGGSDYHRDRQPVRLGQPVTWIQTTSPQPEDLLAALRQGHAYISCSLQGPRLSLVCGQAGMGDLVRRRSGQVLQVCAEAWQLKRGQQLQLVTDRGLIAAPHLERPLNSQGKPAADRAHIKVTADTAWRYIYAQVTCRLAGQLYVRAISNPLYFAD
ncbi:CehA/McbA family metallohydrolase [Oscillospiraceae bacterium HV4-5-C5C]|nr:CehA/McbA family metallohydrolase [Oscillospiraceae bacterium HV4-5-C5C]